MQSYCISLGLKSSDFCPYKRAMRRYGQPEGRTAFKAETETGVMMQLQARDARDWDPLPRARKRKDGFHLQSQIVLLTP